MISGGAAHTHIDTLTPQQPKEAHRALLLKWSKLPRVKERLLLKKDREQRGREKEGEAPRIEEFSVEKAESDSLTVGSRCELQRSAGACFSAALAAGSGNVCAPCGQVQMIGCVGLWGLGGSWFQVDTRRR